MSLALSLHAPTQDLRLQIVPSARAFKLSALMQAVREYQVGWWAGGWVAGLLTRNFHMGKPLQPHCTGVAAAR